MIIVLMHTLWLNILDFATSYTMDYVLSRRYSLDSLIVYKNERFTSASVKIWNSR